MLAFLSCLGPYLRTFQAGCLLISCLWAPKFQWLPVHSFYSVLRVSQSNLFEVMGIKPKHKNDQNIPTDETSPSQCLALSESQTAPQSFWYTLSHSMWFRECMAFKGWCSPYLPSIVCPEPVLRKRQELRSVLCISLSGNFTCYNRIGVRYRRYKEK